MKLGRDGSDQSPDRFFHAPCCSGVWEALQSSRLKARGGIIQLKLLQCDFHPIFSKILNKICDPG